MGELREKEGRKQQAEGNRQRVDTKHGHDKKV